MGYNVARGLGPVKGLPMLTQKQREELEALGPENVRMKLIASRGQGLGASMIVFKASEPDRGDVEDWLAQKYGQEMRTQRWILIWAMVGGVAGVIGVLVTLLK
jgi:hypothetical protein